MGTTVFPRRVKGMKYMACHAEGVSVIQSSACLRRKTHHVRLDLLGFLSPLMCALDGEILYTAYCIRKSRRSAIVPT